MNRMLVMLLLLSGLFGTCGRLAVAADTELGMYEQTVRPLLTQRCQACHGSLAQEGGLRLDTTALLLAGGDSGPAVIADAPEASLLIVRVSDPDPAVRMPPDGEGEPLSPEEIAALTDWIRAGCPAPKNEQPETDPRDHWAFQPRVRPPVPTLPVDAANSNAGSLHPVDLFIDARLAAAGITPQGEADRYVLIRRLYLDLIGVPPSPEEFVTLMADTTPDWYEQLVDRLLEDPRHGQRWARHWMDIWRYSDWWGLGKQLRNSQHHMWHFRDWIVESLNADLGYDEMIRSMLAADELDPDNLDRLRATGFLARNWFLFNRTPWMDDTVEHVGKAFLGLTTNCAKCHDHKYDPISQEDYYRLRAFFEPLHVRLDVVPGQPDLAADGIPRVFDALLEEPTYLLIRGDDTQPDTSQSLSAGVPELLAFDTFPIRPVDLPKTSFEPARRAWVIEAERAKRQAAVEAAQNSPAFTQQLAEAELAACQRRAEASRAAWALADAPQNTDNARLQAAATKAARMAVQAESEVSRLRAWQGVEEVAEKLGAATTAQDSKAVAELEKQLSAAREKVEQATAAIAKPGEAYTPFVGARWTATRFQHSGRDDPVLPFPSQSSGRRTALAQWITDARHPLTARVAANHLWGRHLGTALVATVFDFGRNGAAPTHPQLLDWLASELVDSNWSMKHLHRLIVTSAVYKRDSSRLNAEAAIASDPDNRLLWRRMPQRLESQLIRDCVLATAGTLDTSLGGPSVPANKQAGSSRRSLYFWHSDISRNLFLTTFDDAGVKECYRRERSIVPQQALALANATLIHDAAASVEASLSADLAGSSDDAAFLTTAFHRLLLRPPNDHERRHCQEAVAAWQAVEKDVSQSTLRTRLIWALFNHNDFVTLR